MRAYVTISIINYRTAELTLACLRSVLADLAGDADRPATDGRIIIVDNASGDGSAEAIADWIAANPDAPVELVRSTENTGFSGGHNLGMAACESEFTLVLNSDAELRPGCLAALLAAAEAHPEAGLFAPRLVGEDGTVQTSSFRFPGAASELIRGAGSGPVTALLKSHEVAIGPAPAPAEIQWASFACILLRRAMFEAIGPMDEGYFLYFEDAEYCHRARRAGWALVHVPEARCVHHRGGSGPVKTLISQKKRLPAYFYASRTRFLYQTGGWTGMISANLAWLLGRLLAQGRVLFGKPRHRAAEAEARDIWINATRPLGPRHAPGE
ncbi:glycosyltransferase family 2 protein [Tropicimonas aquimaris]|uniref:Glycosyltransferase family 2 protein n=1 Tax=Tropicimonas aquimaris TaxID=914152 RepID=A0ABW3IKK2_9RHOB